MAAARRSEGLHSSPSSTSITSRCIRLPLSDLDCNYGGVFGVLGGFIRIRVRTTLKRAKEVRVVRSIGVDESTISKHDLEVHNRIACEAHPWREVGNAPA